MAGMVPHRPILMVSFQHLAHACEPTDLRFQLEFHIVKPGPHFGMPRLAPRETLCCHHKPILELAARDMVKLDGGLPGRGSVVPVHCVQFLITLGERKERFCSMGTYAQMMVETFPVLAGLATQTS